MPKSNCFSINLFTRKIKQFKKEFDNLIEAGNIDQATKIVNKIEKVLTAALNFANHTLAKQIEENGQFYYVADFDHGRAIATTTDRQEALIDTKGEIILSAKTIRPSGNNDGNYLITDDEEINDETAQNFGIISGEEYAHYIDKNGDQLSPDYEFADQFSDGFARVHKDGQSFFIDASYQPAEFNPPERYSGLRSFKNGIASVRRINFATWEIINTKGQPVLEKRFLEVRDYSEGLIAVKKWGQDGNQAVQSWYYIDLQGNEKFELTIPSGVLKKTNITPLSFSNGMARIRYLNGGKSRAGIPYDFYDYVDQNGNHIGQLFEYAEDFHFGVARVKIDNKYFYIDKSGNIAFDGKNFDKHEKFSKDGFMAIKDDTGQIDHYMDTSGRHYSKDEYNQARGLLVTPEDIQKYLVALDNEQGTK